MENKANLKASIIGWDLQQLWLHLSPHLLERAVGSHYNITHGGSLRKKGKTQKVSLKLISVFPDDGHSC